MELTMGCDGIIDYPFRKPNPNKQPKQCKLTRGVSRALFPFSLDDDDELLLCSLDKLLRV